MGVMGVMKIQEGSWGVMVWATAERGHDMTRPAGDLCFIAIRSFATARITAAAKRSSLRHV